MQSFSAMDQLLLFPKERSLFLHESSSGLYNSTIYYWAKTIAESWSHVLFAFVAAAVTYEMYGLRDEEVARLNFYLIIVLVTVCGAALLTAVGSLCKNMEQSNGLATIILLLYMIFDGSWVNKQNIPIWYRWAESISFMGLGVEAAVANEFRGMEFQECQGCEVTSGEQALEHLGMDEVTIAGNLLELFLWTVFYRVVAFLGLHFMYTGASLKERAGLLLGRHW